MTKRKRDWLVLVEIASHIVLAASWAIGGLCVAYLAWRATR